MVHEQFDRWNRSGRHAPMTAPTARAPGLRGLLSPGVSAVETFGGLSAESPAHLSGDLFPDEAATVAHAVPKRRHEFRIGRVCARSALSALGFHAAPLLAGRRGALLWPPGVVGSITHSAGYVAAAVAPVGLLRGIGIDAEIHEPLPPGVVALVARDDESPWVERLARTHPDTHWDRLVFSAKESVYKVWSPLTGLWLDFADVRVVVSPTRRTFVADIAPASDPGGRWPGPTRVRGRWTVHRGLLITAVELPVRE